MKKILCIVLALLVLAALGIFIGSCSKNKSESSSSSPTEATKAPATQATAATAAATPTYPRATLAPVARETQNEQYDETTPTEETPTEREDSTDSEYYGQYGGISGQDAILKALDYAGAGYQCVHYDREYLQNQEAWYVGVQAADGSDDTIYYLYVNADQCVPVAEIPDISGNNSGGSEDHAGISEQEAISRTLEMYEDDYTYVSSEPVTVNGGEYWRIGLKSLDETDDEIYYFLVDSNSCSLE